MPMSLVDHMIYACIPKYSMIIMSFLLSWECVVAPYRLACTFITIATFPFLLKVEIQRKSQICQLMYH